MRAWGYPGYLWGDRRGEGSLTGLNDLKYGVFVSDKSEFSHKKAQKPAGIGLFGLVTVFEGPEVLDKSTGINLVAIESLYQQSLDFDFA